MLTITEHDTRDISVIVARGDNGDKVVCPVNRRNKETFQFVPDNSFNRRKYETDTSTGGLCYPNSH